MKIFKNKLRIHQFGFTIIELMIAMTVLSFIGVSVYSGTTKSFQLRESLSLDGDFYSSIRVATDTFGRDIIHLFSPQQASLPDEIGLPPKPNQPNTTAVMLSPNVYKYWGALINEFGVRPTRFTGEETSMSFVSNSHIRLYKDSSDSEFAKITYKLETDKNNNLGEKILVKIEDPEIFSLDRDDSERLIKYQLLFGVKNIKFKYLDGEKDQWYTSWDNTSMDHKDKYPALIEMELEMSLPKTKNSFIVVQRYRPELPL